MKNTHTKGKPLNDDFIFDKTGESKLDPGWFKCKNLESSKIQFIQKG